MFSISRRVFASLISIPPDAVGFVEAGKDRLKGFYLDPAARLLDSGDAFTRACCAARPSISSPFVRARKIRPSGFAPTSLISAATCPEWREIRISMRPLPPLGFTSLLRIPSSRRMISGEGCYMRCVSMDICQGAKIRRSDASCRGMNASSEISGAFTRWAVYECKGPSLREMVRRDVQAA